MTAVYGGEASGMSNPIDQKKTALLGYSNLYVEQSEPNLPGEYVVHSKPDVYKARCPECRKTAQQKGTRPHDILDYISEDGKITFVTLSFSRKRFYCPHCAQSSHETKRCFSEEVPEFYSNKKISKRLARYLFFLSCSGLTRKALRQKLKLSFYPISDACETVRYELLSAEGYAFPHRIIMKEFVVNGRPTTIVCDADKKAVVFFAEESAERILDPNYTKKQSKSASAIAPNEDFRRKERLRCILANAETVIVDPDCRFLPQLKARITADAVIVADAQALYRKLYADFQSIAKQQLPKTMAVKLFAYVPRDFTYSFTDQKEYNLLGRALDTSGELQTAFSVLNSYRKELGESFIRDDNIPAPVLINHLISKGFLSQELSDKLFLPINYERNYDLEQFEGFMDFLTGELGKTPKTQPADTIENRFYFSAPGLYEYDASVPGGRSPARRRVSLSCFREVPDSWERVSYLGKSYDDIRDNIRHMDAVMSGAKRYTDPVDT